MITDPQTHVSARTPSPPARGLGESPVRTGPRHAWVAGTPAAPGEHPALVAQWRRAESGQWQALVVWVVEEDGVLLQQWLSEHLLRPA